ncbi:MAG: poly-beta,6-N-acetyl-D-glucosamine N-deacetylase [Solirubrobacteraceae bacterium]|jgi:hypothetical protein|nr:poly-beta,6-N-acetyl-D-glucosamine N-deacetylase [Solirubrobacteraceae bacterium]
MRRFLATMLLPLSLVPVAFAVPYVAEQHESFSARYLDREALASPDVGHVTAPPVPAYRDRVPVLAYHGINDGGGAYALTQTAFAKQMAALDEAGFHTISAHTYARFARGEQVRLPERPILLTFDDGRVDSFRGADAVLEEHGFRATMFAIAGQTVDASRTYLGPDELASMEDSGRWDIQEHAGDGHVQIASPDGKRRPYYATLQPGETLGEFRTRVAGDLDEGARKLAAVVPDADFGDLFAVPYSDYGQTTGNPLVAGSSLRAMTARFTAVFVQHGDVQPTRRGQHGLLPRYEPKPGTTPQALLRVLRRGIDKEA